MLLVPDSIFWVTGTIAKSIAANNEWMESTIVSGPLLHDLFGNGESIGDRFDLVHFICPYASRAWLPRLRGVVPVVTSHHHVTSWELIRHNLDGDAVVAGSAEWVHDLDARGADMSKVFRVPYGVNVELFAPPKQGASESVRNRLGLKAAAPIVGFFAKRASNDDDRKGTDVFVEAVMQLRSMLPNAGVLIVGPGWQDLVKKFRDAGVACAWLPFVEETQSLPPLYNALDFYWVTARVEGGPVPLLEAMSSEVCCLSTPVGLAREVVRDGVNGFLLPMNDPSAFAEKTAELWADPARRRRITAAARETMVAEMRDDEMARLVEPVYERALEVFAIRNPGTKATRKRLSASETPADRVPRSGLTRTEQRRAQMLESLAWSENLILYQNQKAAALRLIVGAWRENPSSVEPARVLLRRFLPVGVVRNLVDIKRRVTGRKKEAGVTN